MTPSAWQTFTSALEVPGGALAGISANQVGVWQNCFYNSSSFKYKSTAAATLYQQAGAVHAWYNAASGTAGNTISFTQAMTLDSSGNLGIGTTTIGSRVTIGDPGTGLSFTNATATSGFNIGLLAGTGSAQAYVFLRDNAALLFGTNNTERARITSAGHFRPGADNTYNLGEAAYRWANIYTADLNLSNRDSQNDVDGTWGEWTIQEGENDLYLINRRNGKKFKFMLKEVE